MERDFRKLVAWIERATGEQVAIDRLVLEWTRAGKPQVGVPEGSKLAFIEPELQEHFPDSASVNHALRALVGITGR